MKTFYVSWFNFCLIFSFSPKHCKTVNPIFTSPGRAYITNIPESICLPNLWAKQHNLHSTVQNINILPDGQNIFTILCSFLFSHSASLCNLFNILNLKAPSVDPFSLSSSITSQSPVLWLHASTTDVQMGGSGSGRQHMQLVLRSLGSNKVSKVCTARSFCSSNYKLWSLETFSLQCVFSLVQERHDFLYHLLKANCFLP